MPTIDTKQLLRNILSDMRVKLKSEFDKNFERKAFFSNKWKKRTTPNPKGTLLMVTGTLRRSISAQVQGNSVRFTSSVPYATIHNEGGSGTNHIRAHTRHSKKGKTYHVKAHMRKFTMPQRQFVGDSKETQDIIKKAIDINLKEINRQLIQILKK